MLIRFLLGVAEGGVWPAILVIISKWFPAEERGRANALFIMNINMIIQNFGWRDVFVIEGVGSILLIFFMVAADRRVMMWLPTILKGLTRQGMTMIGVLTALPFFAAMGGLYLIAHLSDRSGRRRPYVAISAICFAVAFVLSAQTRDNALLAYGFLLLCGFFHNAYNGLFWALPPRLFASEACGGARGFINGVGNLGGFLGPFLVGWVVANFGSIEYGIYVLSGFLTLAFLTALTLPARLVDDQPE